MSQNAKLFALKKFKRLSDETNIISIGFFFFFLLVVDNDKKKNHFKIPRLIRSLIKLFKF